MASEKNLVPSKRHIGATSIDNFMNVEIRGEKSIINPYKTDNVFDMQSKFNEERNSCMKFCLYGMIQSKWCDSDSLKIDLEIRDSSTNINPSQELDEFWVYDKSTNQKVNKWSIFSRRMDDSGGSLSLNLYRKKKGSYFFPFEIDLQGLRKDSEGILRNKSIFVTIKETNKNAFLKAEFPFIFFLEDGQLLEFGQETAEILDNGEVLEIDNNYPFMYDRHWIRKELIPEGPPLIYFVSQEPIVINEGGENERVQNDKLYPIEIALSKPSMFGLETAKIEVFYGSDQDGFPYTTVIMPSDVMLADNIIRWKGEEEGTLKTVYLKLIDDFLVEPQEKVTIKLTPVYGCKLDPEKSELLTFYINDNDVPSFVSFNNQNITVTEPRGADGMITQGPFTDYRPIYTNLLTIKIDFSLDKKVLVPFQRFDVYVDQNESDFRGLYSFDYANFYRENGRTSERTIQVNENDVNYSVLFSYVGRVEYDKPRKLVLKLRNFTPNLRPLNVANGENKLTIYFNKNIDERFVSINIPYNAIAGNTILRNVYNVPQQDYLEEPWLTNSSLGSTSQNKGGDLSTEMAYFSKTVNGKLLPNYSVIFSGDPIPAIGEKNIKTLVEEQEFDLIVKNSGTKRIYVDYNTYDPGQELVISVRSGITLSTSTNAFTYDGEKFILRLPANREGTSSFPVPIVPQIPNLTYPQQLNLAIQNGTLTYSAYTYAFKYCSYEISIRNLTYNFVGNDPATGTTTEFTNFKKTNLLTKKISMIRGGTENAFDLNYYTPFIDIRAGDGQSQINYYLNTLLIKSKTRKSEPIEARTGTTLSLVDEQYFYEGAVIIPRGVASELYPATKSQIFISPEKPQKINAITFFSGTSSPFSYVLPTSNILLPSPISAFTSNCLFVFGPLWVQNGYGSISSSSPLWNGPSTQESFDGFVAAVSTNKQMYLSPWASTNPNTRNQAVIEIVNIGEVDSFFPSGIVASPGEKVVFSESPLAIPAGSQGIYNIVSPLSPLSLLLSTNSNYDQSKKKFLNCSYKISFLNFRIYSNFSNSPSVPGTSFKTVNYTINFNKDVFGEDQSPKPRYLLTRYTDRMFLPTNFNSSVPDCDASPGPFIRNMLYTTYTKMYVQGMVITPSSQCPIETADFVKVINLPPMYPGTNPNKFIRCCAGGLNGFCSWLYD